MTTPKGFKELVQFLENKNGGPVEASEIQQALQENYGMTSGAVTGIIKRAYDQKVINKIDRGQYELNNNGLKITGNKNSVASIIHDAIDDAISKIETVAGRQISVLSPNDLKMIQEAITKLKNIVS